MPAIPLGQLANLDIQALIEKTYGAIFMGVVASAILFGVTNSQMFLYYKTYAADPLWQKIFVAFLWVMDACHLAFNIHAVYFYVIIHYLQPDFEVAWSFRLKPILDSIITVSVNTMYALRLWRLYRGGRKILVPVVVTTLLIASLGAAIAAIYYSFIIKTFGDVNHIKYATMPNDLIYLCLEFVLIKLYVNSFMAM
ncbi:hypothetical protein GLOTRDRAFT_127121 [Gloeophyllum trabeum ATCC 11539]|uniref:Uncharacterized protein n=1 Tax=Gloeophyllum trabeum (strain ATCC 11539 / FP-39264 / Madison 617) TaxID=670483 RepID=S7QH88_GLOTA|nr:uncharacterized protein GLOTRDRAFT_127121 [Gloeophyllum trabeum ATCC 11539]EPQ58623.1 hypothetical protein GLOTRDRAFT_127121 [Gloeophyllum trabeum ATCC 11539]